MIDAICLLLNRAPFDYAKAAGTWLLTGRQRAAVADAQHDVARNTVIEDKSHPSARRFGFTITGIIIALIVGPVFVFGVYTILTSIMSL